MRKIIVIGGGAAGMMAAAAASGEGGSVELYEKNEKLGKKLYITGKGRCNLTNACEDPQEFLENVVSNPKFLYSSYYGFDNRAVMEKMEEAGLRLKVERGQRVFPVTDKSSDVIRTLEKLMKQNGVKVLLNTQVLDIRIEEGRIAGIHVRDARGREEDIAADAVIIATGGLSYPSTGSTGDGYIFAKEAGHRIIETKPSLVPFTTSEDWVRSVQGLSLKNIALTMYRGKKKIFDDFGEMMFTHFGITGPVVLSASTVYAGLKGGKVTVHIDLKPALTHKQLDERILRDFAGNENKQLIHALNRLLPSSLIPVVIDLAGLNPRCAVRDIRKEQRQEMANTIKDLKLTVTGTRGYAEAVITHGGVNVREVRPDTMESKKTAGLYFAGEVLDLDAVTGGFNLQIAWSTGYAAGIGAARGGSQQ